jgi:hypothetical protein
MDIKPFKIINQLINMMDEINANEIFSKYSTEQLKLCKKEKKRLGKENNEILKARETEEINKFVKDTLEKISEIIRQEMKKDPTEKYIEILKHTCEKMNCSHKKLKALKKELESPKRGFKVFIFHWNNYMYGDRDYTKGRYVCILNPKFKRNCIIS